MRSIDASLLFYAFNADAPQHAAASVFIETQNHREDVLLSEFILTEFYVLLRNPALLKKPLTAPDAVEVIQTYRHHPLWQIAGIPSKSRALHDNLWKAASKTQFARRRIYDARTALSLIAIGVAEFASANPKDFQNFGFKKVWNPLLS